MASYTYEELKKEYDDFDNPVVVLTINNKDFKNNKNGFIISDIEIELTCGYEASIATFCIYNVFQEDTSKFLTADLKKYICLGSTVEIALGYAASARLVFCGFIAKVNFFYEKGNIPGVKITAMDIKGLMMANNYSKQLSANTYSSAVREIFNKNAYLAMNAGQIIKNIHISDTPDINTQDERTIEMVCESDYEFVVKAAKKYNFEFFTEQGDVYFRKAKSNNEILLDLSPESGIKEFDVEYDITGLVAQIEARAMDNGNAKIINAKKSFNNKISMGNKAKKYIKKSEKVYLDPSIYSKQEAENRVNYLMEEMSYRFGTFECTCIGLPEIVPGRFVKLDAIGYPPENKFYIVTVRHRLSQDYGFETFIVGKASDIGAGIGGVI